MQRSRHIPAGLEASARRRRVGSVVLALFAVLGCVDGSRSTTPDTSGPGNQTPFIAAVKAEVSSDPGVYISLPPGSIVGGDRAILSVQRTGSSTLTTLIDGGFDPVLLRAAPGDVVTVIVDLGEGRGTATYAVLVPKPSRPIVVRTRPPKQKRDVPLYSTMYVVFSEPISTASLTDAAVQLTRDGQPVKGRLEFADAEHLTALFTPEVALEPATDYVLVITEAIHDLDGSALGNAVSVPFTTTDVPKGPALPSLVFTVQPTTTQVGAYINPMVQVAVVDSTGQVMTGYTGDFRIRLTNAANAHLTGVGNLTVDAGVATFPYLGVDAAGVGYMLVAEGDGVTSATSIPFAVSALPPVGTLAISVTTSGTGIPSGYQFSIDGGVLTHVGVNASDTIAGLFQGSHNVALSALGSNCMVTGDVSVMAEVVPYQITDVRFVVTCGTAGNIRLITRTTGTDPDQDGYALGIKVAGLSTTTPLPASGTIDATLARVGSTVIQLSGVAENCVVAGSSVRQVDVQADEVALISFDVSCGPVTQLAFVRDGQIYLVNSNGTNLVQLTFVGTNTEPAWSPDGKRIAFSSTRANRPAQWMPDGLALDIYVMDADGSNVVPRTTNASYNGDPVWSPDGRRIAFTGLRDDVGAPGSGMSADVYTLSADGEPNIQRVTSRPGYDAEPAWSPDGRRILFVSDWRAYDFVRDLYAADAADGANVTEVVAGPFFFPNVVLLFQPTWSTDGRIAVVECSSGYFDCERSTVAILHADGSNRVAVSTGTFFSGPTWSPGGGTLAFTATNCPDCARTIRYVRVDGSHEDTIINNGNNAAWRPRP